jgi:ribosomal protein S18 acetylase RimI-like enzyme
MTQSNLDRMIHLAEDFFATKNDPQQISVTEEAMEKLRQIHPATLSEEDDGSGPVAWVLIIPTTNYLMTQFIAMQVSESELLQKTPIPGKYEAVYLCSALVLPEHRGKGLAKRLACRAIKDIGKEHQIKHLFCWAFSSEGAKLASSIASEMDLPLLSRPRGG